MDMPTYTPAHAPVPEGVVVVERATTAQELGAKLNRTAADVVRFLMQQGEMVTATQSLSDDMLELFAAEIGAEIRLVDPGEEQEVEMLKLLEADEFDEDIDEDAPERPPVVTVMGHVDHGKTTLLDAHPQDERASPARSAASPSTSARTRWCKHGKDHLHRHPGPRGVHRHAGPGAEATDIVVLVVAADDGVMPQTVEAINHAKAADVPIIVAVNKIDQPERQPRTA